MEIEIFNYNDIYYEITSPDTVCVSGVTKKLSMEEGVIECTGDRDYYACIYKGDIVIPAKVVYNNKEYDVTEIGKSAFLKCEDLKNVVMPDSIIKICDGAFLCCDKLNKLLIPNSVREIGDSAFSGCANLKSLRISKAITKIYDLTFSDCIGLTNFSIPDKVNKIDYFAFSGCYGLKSITIGRSVQNIACYAFEGCTGLERVNVVTIYPPKLNTNELNLDYIGDCESFSCYDAILTVPLGTKERYLEAEGWKKFKKIEEKDFSIDE